MIIETKKKGWKSFCFFSWHKNIQNKLKMVIPSFCKSAMETSASTPLDMGDKK